MNDGEVTLDKDKLAQLLKERGISRKQLAELSQVPLGSINHWFSGRSPRAIYIFSVARALGIDATLISRRGPRRAKEAS